MAAKIQTAYGNVIIDDTIIARMAGLAALDCAGVVGMASLNITDGFVRLVSGENLTQGVKVTTNNEDAKVNIDLHIIVSAGSNLQTTTENLCEAVTYKINTFLGLEVEDVTVHVDGIRIDEENA